MQEKAAVSRKVVERILPPASSVPCTSALEGELDDSFSEYLIIGHNGDGLSILAYPEAGVTEEDPVFELIDHERNLTYGVQEILTPQQAAQLLQEHGQPPEESDDDQF